MNDFPTRIDPTGIDAYKPAEITRRIEESGVAKAELPFIQLLILSCLAGAFIALGAAAYTAVLTGVDVVTGPLRLLGGLIFSTGLILVVVAGAELFTGNALIVIAWVEGRVSLKALLRNWMVALAGNAVGALSIVVLMFGTGLLAGPFGETARHIAETKLSLGPVEALCRGILCNMLVCLAVWLTFAARSVVDKILAIIFPVTCFVLLGYEHSIANLYLIPAGWAAGSAIDLPGFFGNLIPVTIGNIIGGSGGVALTYALAYRPLRRE
jgi:formate/nitrite transporter